MKLAALRERVVQVTSQPDCHAEFFFLFSGEQPYLKSIDLDPVAQTELAELFIQSIAATVTEEKTSLLALSGADERVGAMYEYDLEAPPAQLSMLDTVIESDQIEQFDANSDSLSQLRAILVLVGNHESQIAIYKHQYPVSLLQPGSTWFGLRPGAESRFSKLDHEIIKVNRTFEFLRIDGRYFILDLKLLERFFGFHNAVKNAATQGVQSIVASDLLVDPGVLSARLDDISFARKLVRCATGSPVLGLIPVQDVIAFTKTHPALAGKFKYNDTNTKLSLETKTAQDLFLKLLNDDFLQSALTKMYYDSIAKDSVPTV